MGCPAFTLAEKWGSWGGFRVGLGSRVSGLGFRVEARGGGGLHHESRLYFSHPLGFLIRGLGFRV